MVLLLITRLTFGGFGLATLRSTTLLAYSLHHHKDKHMSECMGGKKSKYIRKMLRTNKNYYQTNKKRVKNNHKHYHIRNKSPLNRDTATIPLLFLSPLM